MECIEVLPAYSRPIRSIFFIFFYISSHQLVLSVHYLKSLPLHLVYAQPLSLAVLPLSLVHFSRLEDEFAGPVLPVAFECARVAASVGPRVLPVAHVAGLEQPSKFLPVGPYGYSPALRLVLLEIPFVDKAVLKLIDSYSVFQALDKIALEQCSRLEILLSYPFWQAHRPLALVVPSLTLETALLD
jgi:hypothetical protein